MFIFTDSNTVKTLVEKNEDFMNDPNPPGRIMKKEEAETMTADYMSRLAIMGRHSANAPIKFDITLEPIALIYNKDWFRMILDQNPAPTYIRIYFGFYKGRHTVLFIGADKDGKDMESRSGEYYIVEDGTVCCPKNTKANGCTAQLALFKD